MVISLSFPTSNCEESISSIAILSFLIISRSVAHSKEIL